MSEMIVVKELPAQPVLAIGIETTPEELEEATNQALDRLFVYLGHIGGAWAPAMTVTHERSERRIALDACVAVAADAPAIGVARRDELPGGPAAVFLHEGPYDALGDAYAALEGWLAATGRQPAGLPREVFLNSILVVGDPAKLRTEVVQPLA